MLNTFAPFPLAELAALVVVSAPLVPTSPPPRPVVVPRDADPVSRDRPRESPPPSTRMIDDVRARRRRRPSSSSVARAPYLTVRSFDASSTTRDARRRVRSSRVASTSVVVVVVVRARLVRPSARRRVRRRRGARWRTSRMREGLLDGS